MSEHTDCILQLRKIASLDIQTKKRMLDQYTNKRDMRVQAKEIRVELRKKTVEKEREIASRLNLDSKKNKILGALPSLPAKEHYSFKHEFSVGKLMLMSVSWIAVVVLFALFVILTFFGVNCMDYVGLPLLASVVLAFVCAHIAEDDVYAYLEREEYKKKCAKLSNVNSAAIYDCYKAYDANFKEYMRLTQLQYEEDRKEPFEKFAQAESAYLIKDQELQKAIDDNIHEICQYDIIHHELYEYADEIADALELGRASTLQEAINIALEDARRDQEETQRRQEAYEQQRILKEQGEEQAAHHLAMQQEAARQTQAAQVQAKAAQAQADAAAREAKASEEQLRILKQQQYKH